MRRTLTEAEFAAQLGTFRRAARRAELQREYWVAGERASFEWFLAGRPAPSPEVEGTRAWLEQSAQRSARGARIERIRIHRNPPTDYQRWLRTLDERYTAAGDTIRYLTETEADKAGLLAVAARDWWLFDDERLMVLTHDAEGRRIHTELITDEAELDRAHAWWDLAVHTTRGENA